MPAPCSSKKRIPNFWPARGVQRSGHGANSGPVSVGDRDVVAEGAELGVAVGLERARLFAGPLELDEERPAAGDEDEAVGVAPAAPRGELEDGEADGLDVRDEGLLDVGFMEVPHSRRQR